MNNNEIEEKVIEKVGFIVDSYHTRTGMPIFVVKKNKYISNEEFQILCLRAKKYKGYYSKFEENRGFIFYDKENANKFNNITEDEQLTFNQRSSQSEIGKGQSQSNERISPNDGSRIFGIQRNDEETSKSGIIDEITDIIEDDKNLIEYQNPEQVTAEEKINRFINKLYSIRDWDRIDSAHKYLITKDGFLLLIYLRKGDDFIKINVSENNNLTFSNISVSLDNLPLYSSFDRRLDGLDINQLLSNYDNENHNIFTDEDNIDVNEEISKLKAEYSEYLLNLKDNEYSNNLYEENQYINQDVNVVDKHNILDAGERLEGAKKYLYQEILRCFNNVSKKNLIEFPLSKVFITPNITKLIKHNLIRESDAALIYAMISSIKEVKKPNRNSRAVEDYVNVTYDKIKALESFILLDNTQKDLYIAQIKKDNFFKEDFNDLYFKLSFLEYIDYKPGDTPNLNFAINHNQNSKIYNKKTKQYSYYNNKTNNKEVALNKIVTSYKFSHNLSDVYDENLLNVRERINYEDSKTKFILYYIKDNAYGTLSYTIGDENEIKAKSIIEQLGNKNYQVIPQKEKLPSTFEIEYTEPFITGEDYIIKTGFTTKEEALNYIQNNDLSRDIRDTINRVEGEKSNNKTKERINIEYNNRKWNICAIIKHSNYLYNFKSFETKKEAEQYLKENYNNLYEELNTIEDKYKNIEYFLPPQKRIGGDYRNGRDISPQEFIDTFGFRGVQFGNWTNDLDRRNALNEAYDAFLDLAKVTNIEPKQLSLNGTLGIAFGARGGGSAAAHYELNNVVINLTKTKGVGTLAHEWFHAVDNYLGRNYKGGTLSMITDNISTFRTTFPFLNNLNNVLRGTAYLKRSVKCGAYWGNINEVYARLFAEWTNYRLQELENRNNFLASEISEERIEIIKKLNYYIYSESLKNIGKEVNILPFEEFSKNEALSLSGFPYPTKNEVQSCSPHFTELFNQIGEIIPRDLESVNLQQIVDNEIETENQLYTESNYDKEYDDNVVLSATDRVLDLLSECVVDVQIINNSDYNDSFLARIGVKIKGVNNPFEDIRTASERICGFTSGNTIYLTHDGINPETPIHEYTHLWCKVIERTRPKEWEEIVSNIKGTPIWNEVLDDEKYAKIHSNDSRIASEALARISGRRGAQKLIKYAKAAINEPDEKYKGIKATLVNNMKKAVQKLWTIVKSSIFRSEKKTNEIADTILYDLITGKTVNKDTLNIIKNGTKNRFKQSNDESNSNHSAGIHRYSSGTTIQEISDTSGIGMFTVGLSDELWRDTEAREKNLQRGESDRLIEIAKEHNIFFSLDECKKFGERVTERSGESIVYFNEENQKYIKLKDPYAKAPIKNICACDAIYEHIIHNLITPNTEYTFKGITEDIEGVRIILEQDAIISSEPSLSQEEVHRFLEDELGLKREDNYFYGNDYYAITDINPNESDNVVRGDDGNIYFIDPLIRLKRPAPEVIEYLLNTRYPKQEMSVDDIQIDCFNNKFNEELEKQINGTLPNNHIYELGMPGQILRSTGIADLPIQLNASRLLEKSTKIDHSYNLAEIKDLVKELNNPVAVFAYGNKNKAQNIILKIQSNEKNFLVGLSIRPEVEEIVYEINSIRNVFPKDNEEWLNWIQQGKSLYLDKKRIQDLINQQRINLADVEYLNLDSIANIIQNFENPILEEEKNKIFNNIDDIEFQFKQDYCNNFKQLDFKELKSKIKITEFAEYIGYKLRKDKTTHKHLIYEHTSGEKICIYNNPDGKPQIYMTIGGLNADKGDIISFVKNKIDNGIINKPINGTSPFEKVNILLHEYLNIPFEDRKVYNSLDEYIQKSKQNLFISDYQPYTGNITIKAVEYMSTRGLDSNDFLIYPFRGSVVGTNTAKIEADINKIPNNPVAFPLYDKNEKMVGVQLVSENYKSFLKGSRKSVGVWHSNIPEKINNIVICEAPLDAISYHKLQGDRNTLYFATCGNVTDGQLDAIKSIIENNKNVLAANYTITLANDNDAAGAMFNLNYILSTLDEKGNTNIHFNNTKDGRCDLMISLSSADTNNLLKLYENLPKEDINLDIKAKDGGVNILYSKDIKTISALNDLLLTSKPQNIKIDVPITKDYNEDLKTLQHINSLSSDKYSYQDVKHNSFLFTDDISKFHKEKKKHRGIKF